MTIFFMVVGVLIIVVLGVIAWRLQKQVRELEQHKKEQVQFLEEKNQEHQQHLNNSIQVLAQGLIDEQLSMTEGAIRISVLMTNLNISDDHREEFSAFFQLAETTSHIPILDGWKKLSKKEKQAFDQERMEAEEKFKEFIIDAARRIKGLNF